MTTGSGVQSANARPGQPTITALLLVIVISGRLLVIANYEPTTALAIAQSSGAVSTLLGTLIPLLPSLLPWLASLLAIAAGYFLIFDRGSIAVQLLFFAVLTTFGSLSITPAPMRGLGGILLSAVLMASAISVGWAMLGYAYNRIFPQASRSIVPKDGRVMLFLLIAVFVVAASFPSSSQQDLLAATRSMWLPAEVIQTTTGATIVGYVLESRDGWTSILREQDRVVLRIRSEELQQRSLCKLIRESNLPVIKPPQARQAHLAACPTS